MELTLTPIALDPADFIAALRSYIGCTCSNVGLCTGIVLLGLRDVGLLHESTDVDLSHLTPELKIAALWRLLRENSHEVVDVLQPGDFLLSIWRDVDPRRTEVHHINVWTQGLPYPYGSQIQCVAREHGGTGKVCEVPLNQLDHDRIERIFRLKTFIGGEA